MKTTLAQATKILEMLKDVSSEQTQQVLESGLLADVLRTGTLETLRQKSKRDQLSSGWRIIMETLPLDQIVITRPHQKATYYCGDTHKQESYQVRIWKGSHGHYKSGGHVSDGGLSTGGPLLLEYYDKSEHSNDVNYPRANDGALDTLPSGYEWHKETKSVDYVARGRHDLGIQRYDVFTIRRTA